MTALPMYFGGGLLRQVPLSHNCKLEASPSNCRGSNVMPHWICPRCRVLLVIYNFHCVQCSLCGHQDILVIKKVYIMFLELSCGYLYPISELSPLANQTPIAMLHNHLSNSPLHSTSIIQHLHHHSPAQPLVLLSSCVSSNINSLYDLRASACSEWHIWSTMHA